MRRIRKSLLWFFCGFFFLVKMGSCAYGGCVHFSRSRLLVLVFCLCSLVSLSCAARLSVSRQKLEVQKHLNRLNKPAVKSIEVPFPLSLKFCLVTEKARENVFLKLCSFLSGC